MTSWGGYAEYVGIPLADPNLVRMPEGLTDLDGASLGCRFMTAYHGIVDRAHVRPGEWVAVHGCGGAGLAAVQIAAAIGANVIAVDLDERKLELAKRVGATQTVNAQTTDPLAAIVDVTRGGAHVAVDALGIAATSRNAICSLRKQGRALQLGFTGQAEQGEIAMPIDRIVLMELQLIGTLGMPTAGYPGLLQMVEAGKLNPKALVTTTVPLEGASRMLEEMTTFQTVGGGRDPVLRLQRSPDPWVEPLRPVPICARRTVSSGARDPAGGDGDGLPGVRRGRPPPPASPIGSG